MTIAYITHPDCLLHQMGEGHPEGSNRLNAIEDQLIATGIFDLLQHHEAPLATVKQLERVHEPNYIKEVLSFEQKKQSTYLDPDTMVTPQTPKAALRAAGALILATDLVLQGKTRQAYCNVRPPGHHALFNQAMGFCFFNNVAVGVAHAIAKYNIKRIAIVDFDVHHGNGTEAIFTKEPRVMLCSTFQHPFYPFSGATSGNDRMINVPLAAGTSSNQYREAVLSKWLPALHKFKPELIFFSAGFDAHHEDHMAMLNLTDKDYSWITREILLIADKYAEGRVVSTLEGGYHLPSLARSVLNHLRILMRIE